VRQSMALSHGRERLAAVNNLCVPSIAVDGPILKPQRTVFLLNRRGIVVDDRDPIRLLDVVRVEIVVESNSLDAGILQRDAVDGPAAATLLWSGFQKQLIPHRAAIGFLIALSKTR